ncbi:MAG TPA: hypothetical protein VMZ26_11480 [Pyrinomonadaceae bacterium]|nr:hypothetical protein [Pyrinomonadaceae bacterium]
MDKLDLKAPQQSGEIYEKQLRNGNSEAKLLAQVGERICPEGLTYVGSFAVHIYERKLASQLHFQAQTAGLANVPSEQIALMAYNELGKALALAYGHRPPSKRNDPGVDEV